MGDGVTMTNRKRFFWTSSIIVFSITSYLLGAGTNRNAGAKSTDKTPGIKITELSGGIDETSNETGRILIDVFEPDSTIRLHSKNRNLFREGNAIEIYAMKNYSKAGIGFYDESKKGMGWFVCHDESLTSANPAHKHCSLETSIGEQKWMVTRQAWSWGEDWALTQFANTNVEFARGVKVYFKDLLIVKKNKKARICNEEHEGAVYYDGALKKHRGCNGTSWNDLY